MDQRYRGNGVLEFAGGLFGTSLDGLEIVMRANYYLRSKQSRRCVCFARIASKHCTYQAARRWRRDEGASVSSGSGVSRRRVLSWRGCDGGVGPQQPWRGRLRSSSRWKWSFGSVWYWNFTDASVNIDRRLERLPKMAWRRIIAYMCRGCMHDDYVHARRNGRAVPLNSRRPKDGKTSHIFISH